KGSLQARLAIRVNFTRKLFSANYLLTGMVKTVYKYTYNAYALEDKILGILFSFNIMKPESEKVLSTLLIMWLLQDMWLTSIGPSLECIVSFRGGLITKQIYHILYIRSNA
ncbi:hypothetical protein ACJX0J_018625, partial [Zea mays]